MPPAGRLPHHPDRPDRAGLRGRACPAQRCRAGRRVGCGGGPDSCAHRRLLRMEHGRKPCRFPHGGEKKLELQRQRETLEFPLWKPAHYPHPASPQMIHVFDRYRSNIASRFRFFSHHGTLSHHAGWRVCGSHVSPTNAWLVGAAGHVGVRRLRGVAGAAVHVGVRRVRGAAGGCWGGVSVRRLGGAAGAAGRVGVRRLRGVAGAGHARLRLWRGWFHGTATPRPRPLNPRAGPSQSKRSVPR
ncbi:hypothetical protein CHAN_04990 [Corynebacterium hansenii]|nr:hypothetical protein CHAN_04990 [Corynebacterium hansenii]